MLAQAADGDGQNMVAKVDPRRRTADVEHQLRQLIESNGMGPGDRIGSERDLAERLQTTRALLRNALANIERDGLIRRVPGRSGGIFVRSDKVVRDFSNLVGVPEFLRRQGFRAGTQVLSARLQACSEVVAHHLKIEPGTPVYDVVRLRLADGEPISLEHVHFPAALTPGLLERGVGGSLTEMLHRDYGLSLTAESESIEIRLADAQEARLLAVPVDAPLLATERVSATSAGQVVAYSIDLFRADKVRIVVRRGAGAAVEPATVSEVQPY